MRTHCLCGFWAPTLLLTSTFQCIRLFYLSRNPATLEMKKESPEKVKKLTWRCIAPGSGREGTWVETQGV